MKYIALPSFEVVSDALNFENDGCIVSGGCDLFTTKAPVSDKRLMAKIDADLQDKYRDLLSVAASLSPPEATMFARKENLSRSSPFGALSEAANRRAFAYLIATLNACWTDYDFSNTLRPEDFRAVKLYDAQADIEEKIYGAHSRACMMHLARTCGSYTPGGSTMWGPQMWTTISEEMALSECAVYTLSAQENPFDEGPEMWSIHYFFYHKGMKRVCYIYARATDAQDVAAYALEPLTPTPKRERRTLSEYDFESEGFGADKRATYWLGNRANDVQSYHRSDDILERPDDAIVDREIDPYAVIDSIRKGRSMTPISISSDDEDEVHEYLSRTKQAEKSRKDSKNEKAGEEGDAARKKVRSLSASLVESMDL